MSIRESVTIKTPAGDLHGELFVGDDGLPELVLDTQLESESFRPATFPATWVLRYALNPSIEPILYPAWQAIERIQQQTRDAKRKAEAEDPNGLD